MIHILVVEDDIKLNQLVCTYLGDCGFEAKGCLNANDAYGELYNSLYDLIISDIMMPGVDGFEFARTVRQVNKHIPIVNAISKCRFSPKWDVVFYRAAYRCYTALYTTSLAGLKPVKP